MPTRSGSILLFRLFGISVYLHYTWFLAVIWNIQVRGDQYTSHLWNVLECIALFSIVLMHEFGHALACRQVGGQANQIVLWPLGGVAYVSPPQRPGAMLWSIAAGPLVNVALLPVFGAFWLCDYFLGLSGTSPNLDHFIGTLLYVNCVILIFNLLPFYPLDGGQILRSLLWFLFGRSNSLMIASVVGFIGVVGLGLLALLSFLSGASMGGIWLGIMVAFMALNCWTGVRQAQALLKLEKAPRHLEYSCPVCHTSPPVGEFWGCGRCRKVFDTFLTQGFCPNCNAEYSVTACPFCHSLRPLAEWRAFAAPSVPSQSA